MGVTGLQPLLKSKKVPNITKMVLHESFYNHFFCAHSAIFHNSCTILLVWQIGKTKVFLRAGQMADLDAQRAQILNTAAKKIQRKIRTHIARNRFIALRKASISMQSLCRGLSFQITSPLEMFLLHNSHDSYHIFRFYQLKLGEIV